MFESTKLALSKENKCKFWLPNQTCEAEYSCQYEFEDPDIGYCIFHWPKDEKDKRQLEFQGAREIDKLYDPEVGAAFNRELQAHFERMEEDTKITYIDCRGFRF